MSGPTGAKPAGGVVQPEETTLDPQADNLPAEGFDAPEGSPPAEADTGNDGGAAAQTPRMAHDDRLDRINGIASRIRGRRTREAIEATGDFTDPAQTYGNLPIEGQEPEVEQAGEDEPEQPEQPEQPAAAPVEPRKFRIKVRGQDRELTEDELIARAQKVESADDYLAESRRILDEAKARRRVGQNVAPSEDGIDNGDNGEAGAREGNTGGDTDDIEELAGVIEEIQLGDPREAATKIAKVIDDRVRNGARTVSFEDQVSADFSRSMSEYEAFVKANPELVKDEATIGAVRSLLFDEYRKDLRALGLSDDEIPKNPEHLAGVHRVHRVRTGRLRDTTSLLKATKESFQSWREGKPAASPARPSVTQQPASRTPSPNVGSDGRVRVTVDRTANRQAMPPQTPRGSSAPQAPAQPSQPMTRSQAIQQMREQRRTGKGSFTA